MNNLSFNVICDNKILAKISECTVLGLGLSCIFAMCKSVFFVIVFTSWYLFVAFPGLTYFFCLFAYFVYASAKALKSI